MNFFGLKFGKDSTSKDIVVSQIDVVPVKLPTKPIQNPALIFASLGRPERRRGVFERPEYDLYEIGRVEDVDGYVRQAFKKKVGLFLKEGFDYIGSNRKIVDYIKARFLQISIASGISHNELIRRCASQLIRKSNAFLIKVRDDQASGGKTRTNLKGKELKPVAGYFPAAPETMEVDVDQSGKPTQWKQRMPSGNYVLFAPEDVVHFTFDRKEGLIFGTPIITPVIDDIRALRKIEENIELLIYKHLFPLFHYIVGTDDHPAGFTEDGLREIDVVRQQINFMPSEGGIVTPERHEIKAIGAESRALRAESYLEHFKRRVFAGLGMSAVDYGEGDTSNKSTSDNMSRALVDDVKDLQDAFEAQFNHLIINELLAESTFGDEVFSDKNKVELVFREVDIDKQIKVENHAADLFAKNTITWDEARELMSRDPIPLPDDPEDQDPVNFPEWHRTFWKLFGEPEKLIIASDEPYSAHAIAAAQSRASAITQKGLETQQQAKGQAEKTLAIAKEKAKPRPIIRKKNRKDSFLWPDYSSMMTLTEEEKNINQIAQRLHLISTHMKELLKANMNAAFLAGLGNVSPELIVKVSVIRREIDHRSGLLINRLVTDLINILRRKIDMNNHSDRISTIRTIFDSFRYRIDFIEEAEILRARNLGNVIRVVNQGAIKGKLIIADEACNQCRQHAENLIHLNSVTLSDVTPHHPGCKCIINIAEMKEGN